MALLELRDVKKSYGGVKVLDGGNLILEEGEIAAVVGYSGSGKTTLVGVASGLVQQDSGIARFDGADIRGPSRDRGVVFQTYALLPWMSVRKNVALAVDACFPALDRKAREEKGLHYLRMVGLESALDKLPSQLSGGMRQRVSLARALAMESRLLMLDEPLGALDALTRGNLRDELARIVRESGRTMLLVTNDVDEAIQLADRIIPLEHGPAARLGPSFEVTLAKPRRRETALRDPAWRKLHAELVSFLRASARDKRGEHAVPAGAPTPIPTLAEANP